MFLMKRGVTVWFSLVLAVAASAGITWMAATSGRAARGQDAPVNARATDAAEHAVPADGTNRALGRAAELSKAFREAARKVLPSVVVIKSPGEPVCPDCGHAHSAVGDSREIDPDELPNGAARVMGSGFLVDPSGIVVTNHHVVQGSRGLFVQLADRRQFRVVRIEVDRQRDLAVLQVDAKTALPAAQLGDPNAAEIGDWVLAMGCPLELEQTVSAGIISAKNRSFCPAHRARMIQTDAAINPGSSGGPLVDLEGRVIGITTSIASEDGGYQGIGFAVPAGDAARLVAQFKEAAPR